MIGAFGDAGERHFEKIEATMQVSDGVGLAHLLFGHAKVRMTNPLLCREPQGCGVGDGGLGTADTSWAVGDRNRVNLSVLLNYRLCRLSQCARRLGILCLRRSRRRARLRVEPHAATYCR